MLWSDKLSPLPSDYQPASIRGRVSPAVASVAQLFPKDRMLADGKWVVFAAIISLAVGATVDQHFRSPSLGWHYQTPTGRLALEKSSPDAAQAQVNLVTLEEVAGLLERKEVIALDARPRIFYELGHLPGALSLSHEQFESDFSILEKTLSLSGQTLLIYCSDASCEDGALVARALQKRGFRSLLLFPGGYAEWEAGGRAVESAQ